MTFVKLTDEIYNDTMRPVLDKEGMVLSKKLKCVISGSFRFYKSHIVPLIEIFEARGIEVLSPKKSRIINRGASFKRLASDDKLSDVEIQLRHLDAIERADFLYVCNPKGYVGVSAVTEIRLALALAKPVYAREPIPHRQLRRHVKTVLPAHILNFKIRDIRR